MYLYLACDENLEIEEEEEFRTKCEVMMSPRAIRTEKKIKGVLRSQLLISKGAFYPTAKKKLN